MAETPNAQVPGLYHRRIGDVLVTAISDGYVDVGLQALQNITEEDADRVLTEGFRPSPPRVSVNCYLLRTRGRVALVDTGSGDTMGPKLGQLPRLLAATGVAREEIDTVLLTHMHPDHSNGLTGPSGERLFPNAAIVIDPTDVDHWHDDGVMARVDARQQERFFMGARKQAAPYRDRMKPPADDSFPSVTPLPLPGHTPGHTGYIVSSGGETLLIWGDICHVPDIQVPHPEVTMAMDTDQPAAAAARKRAFAMAADDRLLVAGMHLHFPGFSHVIRRGDGYALTPEGWAFEV